MSDFESNKTLAAVGSLLMIIPGVNIVGAILVFLSMKGLSEYYKDDNIFNGVLKGLICSVIGTICAVLAGVAATGGFIFGVVGGIIGIIVALVLLVVALVFLLMMASSLRKAFNALADRSGVQYFRTAGTLLWYGAILSIIFVGLFLIFVAYIFLVVAFFSLKASPTQPSYNYMSPPTAQPPPTESTVTKSSNFCPNCGTPVSVGATFCAHCGKQL